MASLSSYFSGVAIKYLSAVDATPKSNQHEIGSNRFTSILDNPGTEKIRFEATFVFFNPDADEPESCHDSVTWYDTRLNQTHRAAEYRLYYRHNSVTEQLREGDFCLIALLKNGKLLIAIARAGSADGVRLRYLFDFQKDLSNQWQIETNLKDAHINWASQFILNALGIEVRSPSVDVEQLVNRFGLTFPTTRVFSELARTSLKHQISPIDNPDEALEAWMTHEEAMFRALEHGIVQQKLKQHFDSVDEFVSFSLSVQNRRKSRVGHALEHRLTAVLEANQVRFAKGAKTENHAKPDFLFPGITEYQDPAMTSPPLRMLAAKTTCKDRWRQILTEATRIPEKHLFTLELAISANQLEEMRAHAVQLVTIPNISATYPNNHSVITLKEFVSLVNTPLKSQPWPKTKPSTPAPTAARPAPSGWASAKAVMRGTR